MNQAWLATAFFFAFFSLILYSAFLILTPFLKAITWAVILAILVYPLYAWVLRRLRGRATLAAIIVTIFIALLIIVPGFQLAWFLADEAVLLVQQVRSLLSEEGLSEWSATPWVQQLTGWWSMITFSLVEFKINWKEVLVQGAQASSSVVVSQVKGVAQNVMLFTVNFIVALITLFFLLRDGAEFLQKIHRLLPMDREHQQRLLKNIVDAVFAVIHGSLAVAVIQGILAGFAYWILGVPFAVLWGVVTAFAALLPMGGSTLVSIPAAIYLFLQGDTLRAIVLLAWAFGVVGTIDNVLKPLLIGNRLGLPILFLFFGILGGIALFGAVGIVLGPAIFALLRALLDLYLEGYGKSESSET